MKEPERAGWYLVFTKPNRETIAEQHLQRQGFDIYLPLLQQHKRCRNLYQVVTEPLFPRYLFIHLHSGVDDWSKIRSTQGCVSLVRFGPLPACVPENLIEQLKRDEETRVIQNRKSTPDFKPGDHVQVVDGALINYKGIVKAKNSEQRITLLLSVTEGYTHSVNLSVHQIKKIAA